MMRRKVVLPVLVLAAMVAAAGPGRSQGLGPDGLPLDLDPVSYELPENMTWEDYKPVPGHDWSDPKLQPPRKIRAALILADYSDQPFVAKQRGFTDDPADFYKKFLITESNALNKGHTINEYWLEDSFGVVGVDADAFGPYTLPGKSWEYGITSDMNDPAKDCPSGSTCNKTLDETIIQASAADVTTGVATNGGRDYDFRFLLTAGWDESGTWEEFGPMKFETKESIPDAIDAATGFSYGSPDPNKPNSAKTRYQRPDGPWTSFFSARWPWAHAIPGAYSIQSESDGASTFAHELSHVFGVLDNYGDPFKANADRDYSGPWDMLSRGTFNGPGGPHNRWQIPSQFGGTMGSHHMLRTKVRLGFVQPTDVVNIPKAALNAGPIIADVVQREQPMSTNARLNGLKYGFNIALGQDTGDTACARPSKPRCDGGGYDNYTVEVVNRVGYDSFTPDAGVLIAKTKNADLLPFLWVVDSHPDDIGATDYVKPNGDVQPYRFGDYRQLSDALFKVGRTGSNPIGKGLAKAGETANSYEDTGNDVKFLILAKREGAGVLQYRVAAMKATPSPLLSYGVTTAAAGGANPAERRFTVTNTGSATDIIRVAPSAAAGDVKVLNDLIEVPAGGSATITVYTGKSVGCSPVVLTARSEGDRSKTTQATSTC